MYCAGSYPAVLLSFVLTFPAFPQQTATVVRRDLQAVAILQQSIAAMAQNVPSDSSATGTVTIVEGSSTDSGTTQILTRGADQTAETITLGSGQRAVIYSNGDAKEISGNQSTNPPLEIIVIDQCPDFPLPLVVSLLNNADEELRYIGQEVLDRASVQHIQVSNSFASRPRLKKLAPFSVRDIWFDAKSGLPQKVAYSRRWGGGATPAIPIEVFFSNYTNVAGILYPFQINKSGNGTPWQTITIQRVAFNTGLADAQFQVE